jgi:2-phosphosulfolactate phosphatase
MNIHVSFTAIRPTGPKQAVCVVIDVLRATSSLTTMFARGLTQALAVSSLTEARRQAARRAGWLLCGEKASLPPAGFDYGNSPSEFSQVNLSGRRAIVSTTNGTRALLLASDFQVVLAASMLNLSAVSRMVRREARDSAVLLLCSGDRRGREYSLEDAFCAGAIVNSLARASRDNLDDGAETALRLYHSFGGSALKAFRRATHGAGLARAGLEHDVRFCAAVDRYRAVPRLRRRTKAGALLMLG